MTPGGAPAPVTGKIRELFTTYVQVGHVKEDA
jgi:hypothetical protein